MRQKVILRPITWTASYYTDPDVAPDRLIPYFANSTVIMDDAHTACIRGFAFEGATAATKDALMEALAGIGAEKVMFTRVRQRMLEDGTMASVPKTTTLPVKVKRSAGGPV